MSKPSLRASVAAALSSITPAQRASQSAAVLEQLRSVPAFASCTGAASIYLPMEGACNEVDTWPIVADLLARGVRVAVPRVCGRSPTDMKMLGLSGDLEAAKALPRTKWGIPEPDEAAAASMEDLTESEDLSLLLVPGVAFDARCGRLGHGRGYYDAFISRQRRLQGGGRPQVIGLALNEQIVEAVPMGELDERLDAVVSPQAREPSRNLPARNPLAEPSVSLQSRRDWSTLGSTSADTRRLARSAGGAALHVGGGWSKGGPPAAAGRGCAGRGRGRGRGGGPLLAGGDRRRPLQVRLPARLSPARLRRRALHRSAVGARLVPRRRGRGRRLVDRAEAPLGPRSDPALGPFPSGGHRPLRGARLPLRAPRRRPDRAERRRAWRGEAAQLAARLPVRPSVEPCPSLPAGERAHLRLLGRLRRSGGRAAWPRHAGPRCSRRAGRAGAAEPLGHPLVRRLLSVQSEHTRAVVPGPGRAEHECGPRLGLKCATLPTQTEDDRTACSLFQ